MAMLFYIVCLKQGENRYSLKLIAQKTIITNPQKMPRMKSAKSLRESCLDRITSDINEWYSQYVSRINRRESVVCGLEIYKPGKIRSFGTLRKCIVKYIVLHSQNLIVLTFPFMFGDF